ncbi:hypothetical protein [uncultured Parabacteroides sp.]|uniref:hypothetical protein n=1 Tax=uncultured Parabacteroides sp. TaxID=512312 RepID=UPI00262F4841|nr:hypothetical protein [uncultured Parabacteroides sp.]
MDKIIKLLVIQIGFLSLGSVFFVWYMLSKKYVCLDSWAWSFCSAKVLLLTVILSVVFFGLLWGYLYYRSGSLSLCILSNMIVNGISALLIIYYPDARSVYEMIGTMPFIGLAVLNVILSATCIYYLNRSLSIPVWQIPENTDGESCNVVINE